MPAPVSMRLLSSFALLPLHSSVFLSFPRNTPTPHVFTPLPPLPLHSIRLLLLSSYTHLRCASPSSLSPPSTAFLLLLSYCCLPSSCPASRRPLIRVVPLVASRSPTTRLIPCPRELLSTNITHLALRQLVVMMRKHQIHPARMYIHPLAQDSRGHHGTLDVPAWAAVAPWRGPRGLSGFGAFPQRKVGGLAFA